MEIRKLRKEVFEHEILTLKDRFKENELDYALMLFLALPIMASLNLTSRDLILKSCLAGEQYFKDKL